jgi:replication-associated recombination protein RarA
LRAIAQNAAGNVRKALNDLELYLAMNAPAEAALVA